MLKLLFAYFYITHFASFVLMPFSLVLITISCRNDTISSTLWWITQICKLSCLHVDEIKWKPVASRKVVKHAFKILKKMMFYSLKLAKTPKCFFFKDSSEILIPHSKCFCPAAPLYSPSVFCFSLPLPRQWRVGWSGLAGGPFPPRGWTGWARPVIPPASRCRPEPGSLSPVGRQAQIPHLLTGLWGDIKLKMTT